MENEGEREGKEGWVGEICEGQHWMAIIKLILLICLLF